mmetsp:Transcript_6894/g.10896  ORF Transcript_6894/g.10896 Transcript_6894/m.10896 type:complete len:254 (+) Transcript_6894:127-888(+)
MKAQRDTWTPLRSTSSFPPSTTALASAVVPPTTLEDAYQCPHHPIFLSSTSSMPPSTFVALSLFFVCLEKSILKPLVKTTFLRRQANERSRRLWNKGHRPANVQARDRKMKLSSVEKSVLCKIRGGGGNGFGSMFSSFNEYIGASKRRCWMVLLVSIMLDTISTTLMKTAQEQGSVSKSVLAFVGYFLSLSGLAVALKSIDVSIAYAVWAALGTAIVSVAGIVLFGERFDTAKILCLSMILLGTIGLNLTEDH